jgi:phosphoribosylformylglycinamidine synthase
VKIAVIRFPGSNCDQDALFAVRSMGMQSEYVWHEDASLAGYDGVFLPGGFSYGDYLRCGAMASRAPIMAEVARFAEEGKPVIGACNGFQVLCEAGLLPGALLLNVGEKFLCHDVRLRAENRDSLWTRGVDREIRIPIAHGEGRYVADESTLHQLEDEGRIAFRYADGSPNGSLNDIAGILNAKGNVLGLMPHPERACSAVLGSEDGALILEGFRRVAATL